MVSLNLNQGSGTVSPDPTNTRTSVSSGLFNPEVKDALVSGLSEASNTQQAPVQERQTMAEENQENKNENLTGKTGSELKTGILKKETEEAEQTELKPEQKVKLDKREVKEGETLDPQKYDIDEIKINIVYEDGTEKELNSSHLSDGIISQLYKDIDKNLKVKNDH